MAGLTLTECPLCGQVRKVLSDFSSVLAILLGCGLDAFLGLATPKLTVPREFKVRAGRGKAGPADRTLEEEDHRSHTSSALSFGFPTCKIEIVIIMASQSHEDE